MKLLQNFIVITLMSSSSVIAQDNQARVRCIVDVVSIGAEIKGLTLESGSRKPSVLAKSFLYSHSVKYNGPRVMEITKSGGANVVEEAVDLEKHPDAAIPLAPRKNKKGVLVPQKKTFIKAIMERRKKTPDLVALAVIPANAKRVTVLMAPAAEGTYRTYVFSDNPESLPFGRARILNLCPHPIALKLQGSEKAMILGKYKSKDNIKPINKYVRYNLAYPYKNKRTGKGGFKSQGSYMERIAAEDQVQIIVVRSSADFFQSSSGGGSGSTMQLAILRRNKNQARVSPEEQNASGP